MFCLFFVFYERDREGGEKREEEKGKEERGRGGERKRKLVSSWILTSCQAHRITQDARKEREKERERERKRERENKRVSNSESDGSMI